MKNKLLISVCMILIILIVSLVSGTFPTVNDALTQTFTSTSNTHNVNMPSTVNSGDLLIIYFGSDNTIVTTPSGWTLEFSGTPDSFAELNVYSKVADGTEGGTSVNVQTSGSVRASSNVYRITDYFGNASGIEVSGTTGDSINPNSPSLSPSWGSEDTLWISGFGAGPGADNIATYPSSYTNGIFIRSGSSGVNEHYSAGSARRELATATENPGQFGLSASDHWGAATIAIRPGEGAAGYANKVINITGGKVNGVDSANIAKVNGV